MNTQSFKIPSYCAGEEPSYGFYAPATGELAIMLDQIVAAIKAGTDQRIPVPGIPGFVCTGTTFGDSLKITVSKDTDSKGDLLDLPIEICTSYIALNQDDFAAVSADALACAKRTMPDAVNPSFSYAMQSGKSLPFTAVIPQPGIIDAEKHGLLTFDEINLCTGFFQTIIGGIVAASGLFDDIDQDEIDDLISEEIEVLTLDTRQVTGAVQTGGKLIDTLIVEPGEDGYPEVYAYMVDAELDVFRIDFDHETFTIDTDDIAYIMMDDDMLDTIRDLREEALHFFDEIGHIRYHLEDQMIDARQAGVPFQDPLASYYTNHPRIEIPSALGERLTTHLGLSQHHAAREEKKAQVREQATATIG